MRWRRLFADIEAQLEEAGRLELEDEVAERIRSERKSVHLVDRLRMAEGRPVEARVHGAGPVRGTLRGVGADWFLLGDDAGAELLVPMASALTVVDVGEKAAVALGGVGVLWKMRLPYALSIISRDRSDVFMTLIDGSTALGTIDVVGADVIDVTSHEPGQGRVDPPGPVLSIPFAAIGLIRRGANR